MTAVMLVAMYGFALVGFALIVNPRVEWKSRSVTLGYAFMLIAVCIGLAWLIMEMIS